MSQPDQSTAVVEKTRVQEAMEAVARKARTALGITLMCATSACAANLKATTGPQTPYNQVTAMQTRPDVQTQPESPVKSTDSQANKAISMRDKTRK